MTTAGARPPPLAAVGVSARAPEAALRTRLEATTWALRLIVGFAPLLVGLHELGAAGPSWAHAALPLGPASLAGLALLEVALGLAVLRGRAREATLGVAGLAAVLSLTSLAAGTGVVLEWGVVAVCAAVLAELEPLRGGRVLA